jgi:DNA polymerase I-like protein with 3'-5' exonuclease and polymerase domains
LNITTGELFALDIETTGLDRFTDKILAIGVYNPSFSQCFDSVKALQEFLDHRPNVRFIMHNGAFDVGFLRNAGCDIRQHWHYDTRSASSLLTPRPESLGLESLSNVYLGYPTYKLDRKNMSSYSWAELSKYCLTDCRYTFELYEFLQKRVDAEFTKNWLLPATFFCADMEYDGVYVDKKGLQAYRDEQVHKRDSLLSELKELAKAAVTFYHEKQTDEVRKTYKEMYEKAKEKAKDKQKCLRRYALLESAAISRLEAFNWNSPKKLQWLLKDYYCLDIADREGDDSTGEAILKELDHPVAKKLCEYRGVEKLVGTCIPALLENIKADGNLHTHYHIGGTRTGRLSSSNPNLQQIPRGNIRSFIQSSQPRSGPNNGLITIDYAQIEVRIIAEVTKERKLIHAFKEGIDPYSVIAQKLLKIDCPVREIKEKFKKERDVSKTAGLSILYGTGAAKLQEVLNKELNKNYSLRECRDFIQEYRDGFPDIKAFKLKLEQALANQKIYKNLLGRPFTIETNDDLYMKSLNTLVQGSASDLVIYAAIKTKQHLDSLDVPAKCRLIIHDEVVWELPMDEAETLVKDVIEPAMTTDIEKELGLVVPLKIEYTISKEWEKP